MHRAAAVVLALTLIAAGACSGDDGDDADDIATATPQPTAQRTIRVATPALSSPSTPSAGEVDVSGVVGATDAASNTIEITRISGADVDRIAVGPDTKIRRASGGTATLAQIRPSNRIVATGVVDGAILTASEITVQDAVPGPAPGG